MKVSVKYQSINQRVNQSIRHYRVPSVVEKEAALNFLLEKVNQPSETKTRKLSLPGWLRISVAAAAVITVAFLVYRNVSTHTFVNEESHSVSMLLPDYSRVVLPQGSSISYSRHFENRKVDLEGEGYFEVREGNTFSVVTRKGRIEVLGTRFKVHGMKEGLEVICYQGKVKAEFGKNEQMVEAGSGVLYQNNTVPEEIVVPESYPGFASFRKDYHNAPLESVIRDIASFFGIRISLEAGKERFFSGSIDTANPETVLEIVTGSLQLNYEFNGDSLVRIF